MPDLSQIIQGSVVQLGYASSNPFVGPAILRAEWYNLGLTAFDTLQPGISTSWRPHTPENVILDWNARMLELLSVLAIEAIRGVYLNYAAGDWLTLRCSDAYETERIGSTFATCLVVLTGSSGTPYTIADGDRFTVRRSGSDVTYAVPGPLTIPGFGGTAAIVVTCDVPGSDGSAAVGEIDTIVDGLIGVTVTNTTAAIGIDLERDEALRRRARLATGPTSPGGPGAAYEYIATSMKLADGTPSPVTKVLLDTDETTRKVTAYYATASGPIGSPALSEINIAIQELVVPAGVPYEGLSASAVPVDIEYEVHVLASLNIAEQTIIDAIEEALTDFFVDDVPIRGFPLVPDVPGQGILHFSKIVGVLCSIAIGARNPVNYATATINGGSTIIFTNGQVPSIGAITPTVVFT
jgi:uncharacterized phage protein gp47/JayE